MVCLKICMSCAQVIEKKVMDEVHTVAAMNDANAAPVLDASGKFGLDERVEKLLALLDEMQQVSRPSGVLSCTWAFVRCGVACRAIVLAYKLHHMRAFWHALFMLVSIRPGVRCNQLNRALKLGYPC